MGLIDRRPRGLLRVLLRAPIVVYRANLGWVFGRRLLYLAHQGRTTGKIRETVLEVVGYDSTPPEVFVISAWGERSDWYRNITARSALEVRLGAQRWPHPDHRILGESETVQLLSAYRDRYPHAWRRIAPILGFPHDPASPEARPHLRRIRAVAFRPAHRRPAR